MATRRETQLHRQELRQELEAACRDGSLAAGQILPPLHELAKRHQLSITSTAQVIRQLVDAGVLHTIQGAGTFVSRLRQGQGGVYLLVGPDTLHTNVDQLLPMKLGFEERITQLGGTSMTLTYERVAAFAADAAGLPVQGVFYFRDLDPREPLQALLPGVPHIYLGSQPRPEAAAGPAPHDWVAFDHVDGGYQAARHLLDLRHRSIAYLGLHGHADESHIFSWSRERQQGWERALAERGLPSRGLAYGPPQSRALTIPEQVSVAQEVSRRLVAPLRQGTIGAVVTANCHAARGLFQALGAAAMPHEQWPAVICFGAAEGLGDALTIMTEMRMPWEALGREAANLLWSRRTYAGEPRQVLVPLRLISRLSSKASWPIFPPELTRALQHI